MSTPAEYSDDARAAAEQQLLLEAVLAIARVDAPAAQHLGRVIVRAYQSGEPPAPIVMSSAEVEVLGRAALLLLIGGEVSPRDLRFRALRRFTRRVLGG